MGLVMKPEMGFAWFQVELRKLCTVIIVTVYRCDHQLTLPSVACGVFLQPVKQWEAGKAALMISASRLPRALVHF